MTVYDYVEMLVNEANTDIKSVEKACGFGNGTISKWKNSIPKADKLYQVALYFNTTIEYFLTGKRPISNLTDMENLLLEAYRSADVKGQAAIIQVCMNEKDSKGETIIAG